MAEYLELEKVLDDKNIITVQTKEYDSIDVIPVDTITDIELSDVQPVKRGHWDYSEKENGECAWYFCSCCDEPAEQLYNDNPLLSEFCPHCGADMR